ncbi:MAG: insulinase family protein [Candidatus Omnitrophica bacterium]|nr:insulinase family protein [Candidatus Omnitrophota bacterium]
MMPKIRKIALIYILVFFILDAFALCRPSSGQAVSRLDNGLRVIVKEDHRNPIVVFSVFLGIGSACEEGYLGSGISHLIEHMLFKGTRKYPLEAIEEILNRYGGKIEGFTSFDYTGYRITILKEHADTAIDILKEMLTSPTFDPGELKKEKQVIKREMDLSRDDPGKRLSRLTFSNAYLTHPYSIPVIGYKDNFDRLEQEDLIDFFMSNYTPEKMVISVVGDIDSGEIYEKIQRQFGDIPRGNNIIPVLPEEPQQIAEKYIEEAIDIEGAYLNIAFHSTAFADKDLYALDLLSYILGEGEGSTLNKKIRLEQGLALSISAYNYTPKYPGLFVISSVLKENKGREALEAILKELEDIKKNGVREEDLTRAKNNFLAGYIYQKETIESQANDLAIGELLTGNPHFFEIYIERIKSVRPDEIKAAANKYLDTQAMTVVALSKSGNIIKTEKGKVISLNYRNITRVELQNKLPVLISENPSFPMVSIVILLKGGLLLERPDNNGISMLTGLMLMDGTDTMTREDIARLYESRGMSIDTYSANNSMGITINCLKEHTKLAFNIASELCRKSVFPETELRREKDEMNSAIDMQDNQLFSHGHRILKEQLFKDHPYRFQTTGTRESISGIRRETVADFFSSVLKSDNIILGICGDCETSDIKALAEKYFSSIPSGVLGLPLPKEEPPVEDIREKIVETQKEQSLVLYGFRGIDVYDKNRHAAEVMVDMLSMESGVLFKKIREREGLAYATGAFQVMGLDPGYVVIYALTAKENISRVRGIISKEINAFVRKDIPGQELEKAKNHLKAMRQIGMQTNSSFIFNASMDELYGLGYNNYRDYNKNIDAVTIKDVREIAGRLLNLDKCAVVIIQGKE